MVAHYPKMIKPEKFTILIALSGKSKSGKSTTARFIKKILENRASVLITSIAGPLKTACVERFKLTRDQVYGTLKDMRLEVPVSIDGKLCYTPREIMQNYGQKLRAIDENVWINKLLQSITIFKNLYDIIIVDDLRFKNEARLLKQNHAILIRLERLYPAMQVDMDISECDLDNYTKFTYHLINVGKSLKQFEQSLKSTVFIQALKKIYAER